MSENKQYQVLARKYRPKTLSELIGQDVLVRTLTHAIEQNRIPHAFVLTGIRGVGKTSTARIIAKCLNYRGADGNAEMTATPADDCDQCHAIEEGRHPDVLEMDAASRTGVNDIREIIESVNYAPVMARYKVYIIDEVHMLSKGAFNALLKTLEEPPPHCKFIFATTEIRKIPVTILSRCMRFDLPRVEASLLSQHFLNIAGKESVQLAEQASKLIAYAAEGSVRDGLSLLDQAIGLSGDGVVSESLVHQMLGMGDRTHLYTLMQQLLEGKPNEAVHTLNEMYRAGSEPSMIIHDLLELTHLLTTIRVSGSGYAANHVAENELTQAKALAEPLSIPFLARLWQMLLKGLQEIEQAPNGLMAAEMVIIRIAYASDMPPPNDLLKKIQSGAVTSGAGQVQAPAKQENPVMAQKLRKFEDLIALCNERQESFLATWLESVKLVTFDANQKRLEFSPVSSTPPDLLQRLNAFFSQVVGERWMIAVASSGGSVSIKEQKQAQLNDAKETAMQHPLVKAALAAFPDAEVVSMEPLFINENEEDMRSAV